MPLGRFLGWRLNYLKTPERMEQGLVLVLPGIDGESFLNHDIARGLDDGGVTFAIEIFDWTTGIFPFFLYHLCSWRRNVKWAARLAERIVDYQNAHPGRPVHLVGHSAGGAMAVLAIERLPPGHTVTSAVLLGVALSHHYNLAVALGKTAHGVWNYHSRLDVLFLGLLTLVLGTVDRIPAVAAGNIGFVPPDDLTPEGRELYETRLHDLPFRPAMMASFNFGEHLSAANRVFVAEWIAPLLTGTQARQ